MTSALLIVLAAIVAIASVGWIIRRWLPGTAAWIGMMVAIAVRVLAVVAVGWSVADFSPHHHLDGFRLLVIVVECLIGLWMLISASAMAYVLAFHRDSIDEADGAPHA